MCVEKQKNQSALPDDVTRSHLYFMKNSHLQFTQKTGFVGGAAN